MKYKTFNNIDLNASILGLSAASFHIPEKNIISDTQPIEIIQYCLDKGVNYVDLGYPYRQEKQKYISGLISRALHGTPRDKVIISITMPSYSIKSAGDFDRFLNMQLDWLKIEKTDFCLLGMLTRENWPALMKLDVLDWAEKAQKEGRIGKLGFSFHDHFQILKEIIASYDKWSIGQFQYSFVDEAHDPGSSGIKYAHEKGLTVVISEPLHRKRLNNNLPAEVIELINSAPGQHSPAAWALRWVWNHPEISVVLGEISSIVEAEEHINAATASKPDILSVRELIVYEKIKDIFQGKKVVPCPSCRPCMPCPKGIDVPRIFEIYNDAAIYNDYRTARTIYKEEKHRIDLCNKCGKCEKSCAKQLKITEYLEEAQKALTGEG